MNVNLPEDVWENVLIDLGRPGTRVKSLLAANKIRDILEKERKQE